MTSRPKRTGYTLDPQLAPRIQGYIEQHPNNQVYTEDIVAYLQQKFPEYKRNTLPALRGQVEKALVRILKANKEAKKSDSEEDSEGPNLQNAALRESYKRPPSPASPNPRLHDQKPINPIRQPKRAKTGREPEATERGQRPKHKSQCERPTARFSNLGGIENILQDIRELVERPIYHPEIYVHLGVQPPCGVLLHGPSGCGKTLLAHAIAGELGVPFLKISAPEIVSGVSGESEATLRKIFQEAMINAPSIVFIDEIDAITPKRGNASKEMERRIVAQLLTCMDDLTLEKTGGKAVIVLGATNRPDSLDQALRRSGRFDREICLGVPNEAARHRILETLSKGLKTEGNFDWLALAKKTPGFVGADLQALMKEAATLSINRIFMSLETNKPKNGSSGEKVDEVMKDEDPEKMVFEDGQDRRSMNDAMASHVPFSEAELAPLAITMKDFENALPTVQPSATREGFATVPDTTWEQIGSLQSIRNELELSLLAPIKHRDKFEGVGLKSTSCGVLLYGPPGCGKTLVAKAMANQAHLNFISVKGPELLNKYVGESERAVRRTFSRARASAPCIIFFDELDALVPRRDAKENQVTQRVVNQMLTEMDGLDARKEIFIIAASNRPDMIDSAILRPGRLDKLIYLPIPTPLDRVQILRTCAKKTPLGGDVDLEKVALDQRCTGYSGADLDLLQREAQSECIRLAIESNEPLIVTKKHYEVALGKVLPSITQQDERRYNNLNQTLIRSRTRPVEVVTNGHDLPKVDPV